MHRSETTLKGRTLEVENVRCRRISVSPDASLSGSVTVRASYDDPAEFEVLVMRSGKAAGVSSPDIPEPVRRRSFLDRLFRLAPPARGLTGEPTLELDIAVPPGFAVGIGVGGAPRVDVGPVGGPLRLGLSGSAKGKADGGEALELELSGSAEAEVGRAAGKAAVDLSGSARARVMAVDVGTLDIGCSGDAFAEILSGSARSASVEASGGARIEVLAEVGGGVSVEAAGSARVRFATVLGGVEHDVSGSARVTVAGRDYGRARRR